MTVSIQTLHKPKKNEKNKMKSTGLRVNLIFMQTRLSLVHGPGGLAVGYWLGSALVSVEP